MSPTQKHRKERPRLTAAAGRLGLSGACSLPHLQRTAEMPSAALRAQTPSLCLASASAASARRWAAALAARAAAPAPAPPAAALGGEGHLCRLRCDGPDRRRLLVSFWAGVCSSAAAGMAVAIGAGACGRCCRRRGVLREEEVLVGCKQAPVADKALRDAQGLR